MKLSDLQDAFIFVGGAAPGERTALVNPRTGRVRLRAEVGDFDELPDEVVASDDWLEIPHENELGLGRPLALAFVAERLPDELDRVRRFFFGRGAYGKLKDLLADHGLLEDWYELHNRSLHEAIVAWCEWVSIDISS